MPWPSFFFVSNDYETWEYTIDQVEQWCWLWRDICYLWGPVRSHCGWADRRPEFGVAAIKS